jgi:hypothetical protein
MFRDNRQEALMFSPTRQAQSRVGGGNAHSRRPRVRRALLLGALLAALLVWAAPSAYADQRELDQDSVKVGSEGFDFGDGSFVAGGLTNSGDVEWLVDENKVTPVVKGELHLNDVADQCARMRIDYYTAARYFLTARHGGEVCADDNDHHSWSVDLSPHTSDKIGKVKVSLEHELANGSWASVGSEWATLSTYIDDSLSISNLFGTGFSFGGDSWDSINQEAMGDGRVEWEFSEGQIRPHVTGILHAGNAAGECARMRIDYYADNGELGLGPADTNSYSDYLDTVYGGEVCVNDNSHYRWSVDRRDYSEYRIRFINVSFETLRNGTWTDEGGTSSFFGT